jgi:aquaporin Z
MRGPTMRGKLSVYACELAGTALMLFWGVTAVAFMWGAGSPVPEIPNAALRRLVTGLLFAGGATAVVYSPLGQRSGAHINPAITLAFWALGKIGARDLVAYVLAQFAGATLGVAAAAAAWPALMRSVQFAATTPGEGWRWAGAFVTEAIATFLLAFTIFVCINKPRLAARTGLIAGSLVALLVMIAAPVSGTSLNPARSFAPALFVPIVADQWIYFVAPPLGALIAAWVFRDRWGESTVCARLYHTAKYPCPFATCGYRLLRPGDVLIREGEIGTEAYLVERGRLDVRRRGATGDEVSIATLGPGDWVGEMSLLLDEARSATVVATSDAQLRRITRQSFTRLLADDPERTQELLRQLAGRVREANARMASFDLSTGSRSSRAQSSDDELRAPRASRGAKGA